MMNYPGPESDIGKRRMSEDAEMIGNPNKWHQTWTLHLKQQPWIKANGRRFGTIGRSEVESHDWTVTDKDSGESETFKSLEELVKVWSID